MEEGEVCPKCYKGKLLKPKVFYRVFEGRHPDFICDTCGAPSWKRPETELSNYSFKKEEKEAQKAKKQEKFDWTRYI